MITKVVDQVQNYLNEFNSKKYVELTIPNHPIINQLECIITNPIEIQRVYLLLHYTFITRHNTIILSDRNKWFGTLDKYQDTIRYDELCDMLSNNKELRIKLLNILEQLSIITKVQDSYIVYRDSDIIRTPNIYLFNSKICNTSINKLVRITEKIVLTAHHRYFINKYSTFTVEHKKILNRNILKANISITGLEFFRLYYKIKLNKARTEYIPKKRNKLTGYFIRKSRFEHVLDFKKTFISTCRYIDKFRSEFNDNNTYTRFLNCSYDSYGRRFHHMFTNHYKEVRKYITLDKGNKLIPLFEIDVTASQPTFTALLMDNDKIYDKNFFNDINSGTLYEKFMENYKVTIDRNKAKTLIFSALFGESNSYFIKKLSTLYPEMISYIRNIKNTNLYDAGIIENKTIGYKLSSGNCLLVQRKESEWSMKVWKRLIKERIRFIPVHDSVIIFGDKNSTNEEILLLEKKVRDIMLNSFELNKSNNIIPVLDTKYYHSEQQIHKI